MNEQEQYTEDLQDTLTAFAMELFKTVTGMDWNEYLFEFESIDGRWYVDLTDLPRIGVQLSTQSCWDSVPIHYEVFETAEEAIDFMQTKENTYNAGGHETGNLTGNLIPEGVTFQWNDGTIEPPLSHDLSFVVKRDGKTKAFTSEDIRGKNIKQLAEELVETKTDPVSSTGTPRRPDDERP